MPVRVNAQQGADKWAQRLAASTQQIQDGVQRVTVAPGQKAAQSAQLWLQRVTSSLQKYQAGVSRVSLADWQQAMIQKGIPRISQGAQAGTGKMAAFLNDFLPHLQQGVSQVERMPKGTIEQSIARMEAMVRHNASFRRGGGGRVGG